MKPLLYKGAVFRLVFYAKTALANRSKDNLFYYYLRVRYKFS
jgi:hypothetical protein